MELDGRAGILDAMGRVYSIQDGIGRYECTSGGSSKFWECWPDADQPGTFATRWGKIGAKHSWNRCKRGMTSWEALDKFNEKRAEYSFIHRRYETMQEAVAAETSADMQTKTINVDPVPAAPAVRETCEWWRERDRHAE